jgi:hypothetical protein
MENSQSVKSVPRSEKIAHFRNDFTTDYTDYTDDLIAELGVGNAEFFPSVQSVKSVVKMIVKMRRGGTHSPRILPR